MSSHRIARLVEARTLEEVEASDAEVEGLWRNAVRELGDSRAQGAFSHAYHCTFHACTAVLRASGYRVRGASGGHHHTTFYAVAALEIPRVSELAEEMQGLRLVRHDAMYDWESTVGEKDLARVRDLAVRLLDEGARWLEAHRPALRLTR